MEMLPHEFRAEPFPPQHISRDRLINLFQRNQFAKVLVVAAQAGYGKSVIAAEFAQQSSSVPVVWYPLKWEVSDPLSFTTNLVKAIQLTIPKFGQQIELIFQGLASGEQQAHDKKWLSETVLPAIINGLAALPHELLIVLENYHKINHPETDEALISVIERSPNHIHFIVTSRRLPEWRNRQTWEAQGKLVTISQDELAFTPSENQELARKMNVRLNQPQIDHIHAAVKGWPIFLSLLYLKNPAKISEYATEEPSSTLARPGSPIYEYVDKELPSKEDERIQDFLCRTSILEELDADTCNTLLGIANASQNLNRLQSSFFLDRVGPEGTRFVHYHEIVRSILEDVLVQRYGPAKKDQLYKRLGDLYESRKKWDQAIAAYCNGAHYAEASRLIFEQGSGLVSAYNYERLETWLDRFPGDWLNRDPVLLVYKGIVLTNQKPLRAEEPLLRARQLFEEQGARPGAIWASGELGQLYCQNGQYPRAIETLQGALKEPDIHPRLKAKLLHYLSKALHGLDRFNEALAFGLQALELFRQLGTDLNFRNLA